MAELYPAYGLYPAEDLFLAEGTPDPPPMPPAPSPLGGLSATARRMMDTLPVYYSENRTVIRGIQAWADEIDRADGLLDTLKDSLVPSLATDALGMLAVWETIMGLPVNPRGVTLGQRQAAMRQAWTRLYAVTAADVLRLLALQGAHFAIQRDTPGVLQDTLMIGYAEGSYVASMIERAARDAWPAHRELLVSFAGGFTLDQSRMDIDVM